MSKKPESAGDVRGVLLPLQDAQLLLPNASIAEVVGYQQPAQIPGAPSWLLGFYEWRQERVPLVVFETLVERASPSVGHRARIAVCKTLGGNPRRPYIGLLLSAMPRLVRVTEDVIAPLDKPEDLGSNVKSQVTVSGETAWIPDLHALEWMVQEALS